MIDKWIESVFLQIEEEAADAEYRAWQDAIVAKSGDILDRCAVLAGIGEMDKIASAILRAGLEGTYSKFIVCVSAMCFSAGWHKRGEQNV